MDSTTVTTIRDIISFGANLVLLVGGAVVLIIALIAWIKGGVHFIKAARKVSKFVDRVDCLIDDFWPELLSGLEKKELVTIGTAAKWTSVQAKILKSKSPIEITAQGDAIITEIGFDKTYEQNASRIQGLIRSKLATTSDLTDFDIEQASLKIIGELFDKSDPLIKNAENYSFNHPKMSMSELRSLLGIFVRDKIIKNPEMRKAFGLSLTQSRP